MPEDDPSELFDVCDEVGRGLGFTKARALVHRDGDWHRSIHVWVVLRGEGEPSVVMQKRSAAKDTHPGRVDLSVAGHLRAGETIVDGLREAEEEIGLRLNPRDVVVLGQRRRVDRPGDGRLDREVQEVFAAVVGRSLEDLTPDQAEVETLLDVPLSALRSLVDGSLPSIEVRALDARRREISAVVLHARELLPAGDGYFDVALASLVDLIAGREPAPFLIAPI